MLYYRNAYAARFTVLLTGAATAYYRGFVRRGGRKTAMIFIELLNNLALIMVMGVLYSFLYRKLEYTSLIFKAASGILFGTIAVFGMKLSFHLMPGIIFDGRSVILSIAGLFGGFRAALIASVMAVAYRSWMGGSGTLMGVLVIVSSAGLGVVYNVLLRKRKGIQRFYHLYLFGILVHLCMIILMSTLPSTSRMIVVQKIALPVILLFPIATVIICILLIDQENRIKDERALRESETRMRTIIGNMPVMLTAFDVESRVISWNAECVKVTGYTADEMVGKPDTVIRLSADNPVGMPVAGGQANEEAGFRNAELDISCKDGSTRTILWSIMSETFSVPGWHSWAVGIDISERKINETRIESALEEKEVLLREIHHRVKNNMQVVSSLLSLQVNKIHDEKSRNLFSESIDRIRAMALVHEMLYKSNDLAQIDFKRYISRLASELSEVYGAARNRISVVLKADEIFLPLDDAIPCAMILNELMANSMKHAFPDGREGTIEIHLNWGEADRCKLLVRDNGIGIKDVSDIGNLTTLGMQMVQALTKQLGGSVSISSDGGTAIFVDFPCGR